MKIKSLYPIIMTNDVEATVKYYGDVFGYTVKHSVDTAMNTKVLVLENNLDTEIEIMEIPTTGILAGKIPSAGIYGFRMNVDNIEEAFDELKAKGYAPASGILENHLGRCLMITDNNGVHITLMQHIKK